MGNNTWDNTLDPHPVARGASTASFTTSKEINAFPSPVSFANELKLGSKVELEAWGEYTSSATPTMQLGFAYGITSAGGLTSTGVIIAANALTANSGTPAAWPWHLHYGGIVTAVGATGVIYGSGILDLGSSLTAMNSGINMPVTAAARSVTIDTTKMAQWSVIGAWGASAAGNILIVDVFSAKIVNQGKT